MRAVPLDFIPRLIGLDFDGTVVDGSNQVGPEMRAALHACHGAGIELAFLTGRRPLTAKPHLDAIGLPCHAATNSGCLLWEYPSMRQLGARFLEPQIVERLIELTAPHSANFYVDASRTDCQFIHLVREPSANLDKYMDRYGGNARRSNDPGEILREQVTQLAMPGPDELVYRLRDRLRTELTGQVLALAVKWPLLPTLALEVFHPDANKGRALADFAERLRIPGESTLAVGDDTNDLAMLEWAGHGVAMPQANGETRASADEVLSGNGTQALVDYLNMIADQARSTG